LAEQPTTGDDQSYFVTNSDENVEAFIKRVSKLFNGNERKLFLPPSHPHKTSTSPLTPPNFYDNIP
jgi:hypothetical protein